MASLTFKFDNTLGAAFIGWGISCLAFGIYSAQCYRYFRHFPSDRLAYKLLVTGLWIIETVDQIFIGHAVYFYTVTSYANPSVLIAQPAVWSLVLQIVMGALGGTIVKGCFAMRVWRFSSHNIFITALILIMTISQLCFASVYTGVAFSMDNLALPVAASSHTLKIWANLSLTIGVATDMLTAAALCWFLQKLRTGYRRSDNLVNSLTVFAVNTGVLTSTVSLATLILYNLMPRNFIFMGVYFVLSKLYAISLLATLNTRQIIRGRGTDDQNGTFTTGNTFRMMGSSQRRDRELRNIDPLKSVEIDIHHEVSVVSDAPNYAIAW